jgi:hypothetical protein
MLMVVVEQGYKADAVSDLLDAEIGGKAWRPFKFPAHTHSS